MTALVSTAPKPQQTSPRRQRLCPQSFMLTRRAAEGSNSLVFFMQGLKVSDNFAYNTRRCSISYRRTGKENQLISVPLFV